MFTLLQGSGFPVSGWVATSVLAFSVLALVALYYQFWSDPLDLVAQWLERNLPSISPDPLQGRKRKVVLLTLLAGLFLIFLLWPQSNRANLWSSISGFTQSEEWKRYTVILDDLLVALVILILISLIPILNTLFQRIDRTLYRWRHTRFRVIKFQNLELLTPDQLTNLLSLVARYVRWAILFLLVSVCTTLVFSLYPETRGFARSLWDRVVEILRAFGEDILAFLPNLMTLAIIVVVARLALKGLHFFYDGLRKGKIRYESIHAELIEPTYQLVRFFIIAFALVAAFPYIPGSSSPVFKGLSIFIGFLLSLGSTSLVSNVVAGVVLTYTRGLKIDDRVQIGETTGDVVDRTLLVTRVRTIKNVIVTIPNNLVLQNQIVNYSAEADSIGLILHTTITIGYDVPWRKVNALMLAAARHTTHVLQDPEPFVLKTSLDDYYVSYELNAYTDRPERMANTYSDLHQNILDAFNQAGVEIMSPAYLAYRDGAEVTIPESEIS